jgi:hypothetical protein
MYRPANFDGVADLNLEELTQAAEAQNAIPEQYREGVAYLRSGIRTLITTQARLRQEASPYTVKWSGFVEDIDGPENQAASNTYSLVYAEDGKVIDMSVQIMECFEDGNEPFYGVCMMGGEKGNTVYYDRDIDHTTYLEAKTKLQSMYDSEPVEHK